MSGEKEKVLLFLTKVGRSVRPKDVAEKLGLTPRTASAYLVGMMRKGYVKRESRGVFVITQTGREVAARLERASEDAARLLREVPSEMGFYFFEAVDRPIGVVALSLIQLRDALQRVDPPSVSFHLKRGDFERWLSFLGDEALVEAFSRLNTLKLQDEEARKRLVEAVANRVEELKSALR